MDPTAVAHSPSPSCGGRSQAKRLDARRVYSAVAFLPLFYLVVRYGPSWTFFILVLAAALLAVWEFYRLHFREDSRSLNTVLGCASTSLLMSSLYRPELVPQHVAMILIVMLVLASRLWTTSGIQTGLVDSGVLLFGVFYVGLLLGTLLRVRLLPEGEWFIFFLFLVTWAGDTGAYYTGFAFGKRKLAPTISPNKTLEGLAGGMGLSVAAAILGRFWFAPMFTIIDCVLLGLILTMAGVVGDLGESALKRSSGVKDSGGLIPGHGGMLDRLDSIFFTAPTFYLYLSTVKGLSA